ncbi:MAG TPA: hypothetical protein VHE34_31010 [Puia sp.]|uniref:hypothetical protein n=1 Tax=Puia sp. TaxID=2045100 RepID=UPI002B585966|nr:hypothetical protein [Puia sp.]HVU99707.1 hypothetical protein [Puia sp.]
MSKVFEWILNGILLVLFIIGIAFTGSVVRAHPLLPVALLLLIGLLSFLFSRVPDYFGDGHLPAVLKYSFYLSVVAAFMCLIYYSKEKASVERLLYGGKIKHADIEIDTDQGPGSDTIYYLDNVPKVVDNVIGFTFFAMIVGVPYLTYRLWQRTAPGSG